MKDRDRRPWLVILLLAIAGTSEGAVVEEGATVRYQVAVAGETAGEILSVTTWDERYIVRTTRFAETPAQHHLTLADWDDPDLGEMHFRLEDEETGEWVALVIDLGVVNMVPNDYGPALKAQLDEEGARISVQLSTSEGTWETVAEQVGAAGLVTTDTWLTAFRESDVELGWTETLSEGARFLSQTAGQGAPLDPITASLLRAVGWSSEEAFLKRSPDERWTVTEEVVTKGQASKELRELMRSFSSLSQSDIGKLLRAASNEG